MNTKLLQDAFELTLAVHRNQIRKGSAGTPYIYHPLGVAKILAEAGAKESLVAAGLLHDTIEDGGATEETLARQFGQEIADWVSAVSDTPGATEWKAKKESALMTLTEAEEAVLLLSCADKIDNARFYLAQNVLTGKSFWEKLGRSKNDQIWYFSEFRSLLEQRRMKTPEGRFLETQFLNLLRELENPGNR